VKADKDTIAPGQQTVIRFSIPNATQYELRGGAGTVSASGAVVKPTETSTYYIVGTNPQMQAVAQRGGVYATQGVQNAVVATPAALGSPKITVPDAALRPLLKTPFRLAKLKTGFKGWELADDDADEIVPALRAVIDQYSGAIDSPHAAAYALAGSILILAGTKYIAFMEWKKDQTPQEVVHTQPTSAQGFETVRGSA
jgi:hypothetical protein